MYHTFKPNVGKYSSPMRHMACAKLLQTSSPIVMQNPRKWCDQTAWCCHVTGEYTGLCVNCPAKEKGVRSEPWGEYLQCERNTRTQQHLHRDMGDKLLTWEKITINKNQCQNFERYTLPETNIAHENRPFAPKFYLPTCEVQGQTGC